MAKIREKAPTKIILIGEHSVVYGRPALVCAIDLYCFCEVRSCDGESIVFKDKEDSFKEEYDIEEILNLGEKFDYKNKKDKFFKIILNEVLNCLEISNIKPLEIEIDKEVFIGGCGVSTSVIVSVARALAKYLGRELSRDDLFQIAMKAETKFHGYQSSGLDQIAIIQGGLIKYQKKEKDFDYEKLNVGFDILKNFLIINSGKPEDLTGEVVEFVRQKKEKDSERVEKIFNNLENLTDRMVAALENNREEFYEIIDEAGEELIDLGIVTPDTQKIITDIKKIGGHLKISGAGAHKGKGSGALVCFSDEERRIEEYLRENKVDFYKANIAG